MSWDKATWHGECSTCSQIFDEDGVTKLTNFAMKNHELYNRGHQTGWVAQCGCLLARFGPGPRPTVLKMLREHQAQQDYDALELIDAGDAR